MARATDMLARLPELYRDGETAGRLAAVWGAQIETLDETANDIRRSHYFSQCFDLDDAAGLAALLDIGPEPFQGLTEFRAWVNGLRAARLRAGAVTREGIRIFTQLYLDGFQRGNRIRITPEASELGFAPSDETPALIENPPEPRFAQGPGLDGLAPLERFSLENRGLDPTPLALVITAFGPGGGEFTPMIANLTTGEGLVFLGRIPPGQRLFLTPKAGEDGATLSARLETEDVTARMRYFNPLIPGDAASTIAAPGPMSPLSLDRGLNDLWFLPLAHFDAPGLDRALFALASADLTRGEWDVSEFDKAIFAPAIAASLQAAWRETRPATIELRIPTGIMRSPAGGLEAALEARENLRAALGLALGRLSAAGVRATATLAPRRERQPMADRLAAILPATFVEGGSTGADRMPEAQGRFGVSKLDDATFS